MIPKVKSTPDYYETSEVPISNPQESEPKKKPKFSFFRNIVSYIGFSKKEDDRDNMQHEKLDDMPSINNNGILPNENSLNHKAGFKSPIRPYSHPIQTEFLNVIKKPEEAILIDFEVSDITKNSNFSVAPLLLDLTQHGEKPEVKTTP